MLLLFVVATNFMNETQHGIAVPTGNPTEVDVIAVIVVIDTISLNL